MRERGIYEMISATAAEVVASGTAPRGRSSLIHWWLKTDLDTGNPWQRRWVSAYYLSRWGDDEAKDTSGVDIPNC